MSKVVLGLIGIASGGLLLVVSSVINYTGTYKQLSASDIGLDLTALISAGSVAFDGLSILCGVILYRLILMPGLGILRRGALLCVTLIAMTLFLGYSSWAAVGFFSQQRGDTVAGREQVTERRAELRREIAEDRDRKGWLARQMPVDMQAGEIKPLRPVETIQAEIDALLRDPGAEGCPPGAPANGPVTRKVCPQVDTLRAEKALAEEAEELTARIDKNVAELASLKAVGTSDAQASFFSWLTGAAIPDAQRSFIVLIVLAFELGKPLSGVLIAMALMDAPRRQETPPEEAPAADTAAYSTHGTDSDGESGNVVALRPARPDQPDRIADTVQTILRERAMPRTIRTGKLRAAVVARAGECSDQAVNTVIGRTMQALGYVRKRACVQGRRFYVYERSGGEVAQRVAA
ncbi:MAG: hypothetical protein ACLFPA_11360 [Dichotomicrobium sp.]